MTTIAADIRRFVWFCAPIVTLFAASPCEADLNLSMWDLETGIQDRNGQRVAWFNTVQSPFQNSHGVTRGASTASAAYDFVFSEPESWGTFILDTDHYCQNAAGERPRCISDGFLIIAPTIDLTLTVEARYAYRFTGHPTDARIDFWVIEPFAVPPRAVLNRGRRASTFTGPWTGVIGYDGEAVLPKGSTYWISYGFEVFMTSGIPNGAVATGDGHWRMELRPVPAPPSLLLLASAIPFMRRHRPRR